MEHTRITYDELIAGAAAAAEKCSYHYGVFSSGRFQIYAFPVYQRTTVRKPHYRYTHYLAGPNGTFYRTNKATFLAELDAANQGQR